MCLVTKNVNPYVAKEDIKVFKILQKTKEGYKTPYQGSKVILGSLMKPENKVGHKKGNYGYDNCTLCVEDGFIHAATCTIPYDTNKLKNYVVVEAYIPKGTEFYISDNFIEIATMELYLTERIVDNNSELSDEEMQSLLLSYPIETSISKDKVDVGWFMLDNKTFVHPSLFNKIGMTPIGIVCEIVENEYKVMSLEQTNNRWCFNYFKVEGLENLKNQDEIYLDDRGQEYCKIISKYKTSEFPAIKWCLDYITKGTNVGDWYLPASGELRNAILNIHIINAVLLFTSIGVTLYTNDLYWSSSEYSSNLARSVYTNDGYVYNGIKDGNRYVRAFLRVSAEDGVNPSI